MNLNASRVPRLTKRVAPSLILGWLLLSSSFGLSAQAPSSGRALGIDITGMDRSVRPQDDFFRFVNGAWVDKTAIPPDRSNYGSFAMLTERAVRSRTEKRAEALLTDEDTSNR